MRCVVKLHANALQSVACIAKYVSEAAQSANEYACACRSWCLLAGMYISIIVTLAHNSSSVSLPADTNGARLIKKLEPRPVFNVGLHF